MRNYELVLVVKSDTKKEDKDKVTASIKKLLGKIEKEEVVSLGEKKFSFPMKGERKGEYLHIKFTTDSVDGEFEKKMRNQENVVRHLLIRTK